MNSVFKSFAGWALLFLLCVCSAEAQKKPKSSKGTAGTQVSLSPEERSLLSFDEYEHLLNLILPIDHATPPSLEYTMVLRFEPHVHAEMQVVLRHWRDGHVEATVYRVEHGNAWRAAYGNVPEGGQPDFPAMMKEISIHKNSFMLAPEQEERWHTELMPTLEREFSKVRNGLKHYKREEHGVVDGTRYELWYIQGDDEIHVVSWDSEVEAFPTGNYALTKWMNLIRWYANGHMTTYVPYTPPNPLEIPAEPSKGSKKK